MRVRRCSMRGRARPWPVPGETQRRSLSTEASSLAWGSCVSSSHAGNASSNLAGVTEKSRDSDFGRSPLMRCGRYVSPGCTLDLAPVQLLGSCPRSLGWGSSPLERGSHELRHSALPLALLVVELLEVRSGNLCADGADSRTNRGQSHPETPSYHSGDYGSGVPASSSGFPC
jgi:hypothetical protein